MNNTENVFIEKHFYMMSESVNIPSMLSLVTLFCVVLFPCCAALSQVCVILSQGGDGTFVSESFVSHYVPAVHSP